jgi:hypothetical protein
MIVLAAPTAAPGQAPSPACELGRIEAGGPTGPYADFANAARLLGRTARPYPVLRRYSREHDLALCDPAASPWGDRIEPAGAAPRRLEIAVLPVEASTHYNSAYPRDRNNGALWTGRGASAVVTTGARLHWGPVSAQLAPLAAFQQNRAFTLQPPRPDGTGFSPYLYPGHPGLIDWPQRFGEDPFWTLDPGQSYVQVEAWQLAAGLSTENLWWGPALDQPILLGNTGPGFPHAYVGTAAPVNVGIGRVSLDAFWGRIDESDYFDADPANDQRLFAGLALAFHPRGLDGLVLGAQRSYLRIFEQGLAPWEYLVEPYRAILDNPDDDNQLFGVYARWTFPESGLQIYGEWAREDAWLDLSDLAAEPDHSLGYVVGLQKAIDRGDDWLRVHAELFRLQVGSGSDRSQRNIVAFFTHDDVPQGYTHRGQLLGAAVGPGSNGERIGVEWFHQRGMTGAFASRTVYDQDAYYSRYVTQGRTDGTDTRDWEYTVGVRQLYFLDPVELVATAAWSRRNNRTFLGLSGGGDHPENNWSVELGARWSPPL